jgi:pyrroline-5-carboxylate reductase
MLPRAPPSRLREPLRRLTPTTSRSDFRPPAPTAHMEASGRGALGEVGSLRSPPGQRFHRGLRSLDPNSVSHVTRFWASSRLASVAAVTVPTTTTYDLAVIGGGNMGAALIGGLLAAGTFQASDVAVVEASATRREELTRMFAGVAVFADVPPCTGAVLAVKPGDIPAVAAAAGSAGVVRVLSIAAGVTTAAVQHAVGAGVAVLRAMPNTPALVGRGMAALCGGETAGDEDLDWGERILGAVGRCERLPESVFDAVTGLTGSGPAYVFLVAEALVVAGIDAGLPGELVEPMVTQLLVGSAALLDERGDPAALRAAVTSPGGTTAAGIQVLEDRAVRSAFVDAVRAATARSAELGRTGG